MEPHGTVTRQLDLGGCIVTLLDGGAFKLDGGAMFGIIPKPLWSRGAPSDDQNRIRLACNCLLVQWPDGRRAVVETGHGAKYAAREQQIFALDPDHWLEPALRAAGVDPAGIADVIVTHLHFDHAGGLTRAAGSGLLVPTFPNARVHVQRQEYEDARSQYGIMTASYRPENRAPIDAAGQWALADGEQELVPGVTALPTPGHTRGHQAIVIHGRGRKLVFGGDVLPTAAHVGPAYNMGYDLFPLENRASKGRLLAWTAEQHALLVLGHEPDTPVVTVRPEKDWFALVPANESEAG